MFPGKITKNQNQHYFQRSLASDANAPKASQMALVVKNHLPMQETKETQVQSLGWEDALEKGMVTHSSILAWRIPWTEEPGGLQPIESKSVGHD